ncbi:RNA-dependent RNA polymerase 1-like isoform X2 [Ziziphus jujuba]|nr:RNA-dependent RNA polymerase 1-like isoform X2 [Ziziphus jujuba]
MDLAPDPDERFWYDEVSYLQARELDLDIEKKPKVSAYSMDDATLCIGGQISEDKFSVLWKRRNVSVKFGMGLRNFYFFSLIILSNTSLRSPVRAFGRLSYVVHDVKLPSFFSSR